ncbi:S8 family serine peptidase [Fundidesulfovibrio putealis]|uniref:S8 family serine peptidase n=1 Tax=Fundidesulfovibrio putealis TaxID=270496 RepID=UPI00041A0BD2|nr:S8 family serine peptidase [Fundidesulfovibrio putealis]
MAVLVNDPLFPQQWHLFNTGQSGGTPGIDLNIGNLWADYSGKGVVVAVVDQGLEYDHPDLAANINTAISFSSFSTQADGQPVTTADNHGMPVGGLIAEIGNNGLGGIGIASGATLASAYIDLRSGQDPAARDAGDFLDVLKMTVGNYDVVNNSWGLGGTFNAANNPSNTETAQALQNAVTLGRNGKGSVVVFAAGNDRTMGADSNSDFLTSSPYTISVAAIDHNGKVSAYSTPGAANLVSAPTNSYFLYTETIQSDPDEDGNVELSTVVRQQWYGGIVAADRLGVEGYNTAPSPAGDYAFDFGGTSAAAPEVSGVIALMLEANPNLGYRDVQDILALTARNTDNTASWTINGADNWNGGGMHVNRDVGYGLVDAHAAVRLSETWTSQSTAPNVLTVAGSATLNAAIPEGGLGLSSTITIANAVQVERAEVILDANHSLARDLVISLTSPSGTRSVLLTTPTSTEPGTQALNEPFPSQPYSMTSTQYLGESGTGNWTLSVQDVSGNGQSGTVNDWQLVLWGRDSSSTLPYVFTNEFGYYAGLDSSRTVLTDTSGKTVINASPVTSDAVINLNAGTTSTVAGASFTITPQTTVTALYTGDGNDLLLGSGTDNLLSSGRGNDILYAGFGNNTLDGGSGFNVAVIPTDLMDNTFVQTATSRLVVSSLGTNSLDNISMLMFRDTAIATSSLLFRDAASSSTAGIFGVSA